MVDMRFDTYYRYDEMTQRLSDYAGEHPGLCSLSSPGRSPGGRELWMMEITNYDTGPAEDKPALYIDGNHHAGEVTGSMACMYTAYHLLSGYGIDERITGILDRTTFYIRPRVSPDGAELYLSTPHTLRSVPRPYPRRQRRPGVHPEDIDGDGWIVQMRIESPDGEYKISGDDERLMIPREDNDVGGTYYHVLPEGMVHGDPCRDLQPAPSYWGMDLNRNYPANWQPEHVQKGSGEYPLSEPETRATADFVLSHPNIGILVSYHTSGHFMYRPPSSRPARDFSSFDIERVYRVLGERYTELTGGEVRQSYVEETGTSRTGSLMDWAYQHLGIVGWVPELWKWGRDYDGDGSISEPELLRWNDEELGGEGFTSWRGFDHPQLGPVQIGGWKTKFTRQNPPGQFLEEELRGHYLWTLYLAEALPRVVLEDVSVQEWGRGLCCVKASVRNTGLLPTNVTDQAGATGRAREVLLSCECPGAELLDGDATQEVGHLAGLISRLPQGEGPPGARPSGFVADTRGEARWVIRGQPRTVAVTASSPRAGTCRREIPMQG